MTYLEKAKELFPEISVQEILSHCPLYYGLESAESSLSCDVKALWHNNCYTCWNREMPEVVKT